MMPIKFTLTILSLTALVACSQYKDTWTPPKGNDSVSPASNEIVLQKRLNGLWTSCIESAGSSQQITLSIENDSISTFINKIDGDCLSTQLQSYKTGEYSLASIDANDLGDGAALVKLKTFYTSDSLLDTQFVARQATVLVESQIKLTLNGSSSKLVLTAEPIYKTDASTLNVIIQNPGAEEVTTARNYQPYTLEFKRLARMPLRKYGKVKVNALINKKKPAQIFKTKDEVLAWFSKNTADMTSPDCLNTFTADEKWLALPQQQTINMDLEVKENNETGTQLGFLFNVPGKSKKPTKLSFACPLLNRQPGVAL